MAGEGRADRTEGSTPDRRRVVRVVEVLNLAFLVVDVALYGTRNYAVVGGRLLVTLGLLAVDVALSRVEDPRALRAALVGSVLALVGGFGLLASGSGGLASPYLAFLAFVPIVLTIGIPDEPAVTLAAGVAATGTGLAFGIAAGQSASQLGFTLVAFGSCAFYGTVSALLYRRMRLREHDAAAARAAAMADLARSERRRLEAERLAAIGRLSAGFSHEVNNPLASATANLTFIQGELARTRVDPEVQAALADTDEALERIRRLVADLRSLRVEGVDEVASVDVEEALDQACGLAASRLGPAGVTDWSIPRSVPPVRASLPHLKQVLGLLVSAAGDRQPSGPSERIPVEPGPVTVSVGVEGSTVRISVEGGERRTGAPGVARARSELCLAICRELAGRWGGRIDASVAPDGSPRFALTLQSAGGGH